MTRACDPPAHRGRSRETDRRVIGSRASSNMPRGTMEDANRLTAQDASAASDGSTIMLTFTVETAGEPSKDVTVQIATTVADRLWLSLGTALAKSHTTDLAEMAKRLTAGVTPPRWTRGEEPKAGRGAGFWGVPTPA